MADVSPPALCYKSVLIVHSAFPGDIVLCTPLLRAVKKSMPQAMVAFLATPTSANLLETNPHLDQLIVYDKRGSEKGLGSLLRLIRRLRQQHFQLALLPHRSLRSALLAWAAGIRVRIGFSQAPGAFLYTHRVPYRRTCHEVERNLALLEAAGGRADGLQPEVFPDGSDRARVDELLKEADAKGPLLGLAPGSIWPTKRWTPGGFAEVGTMAMRTLAATVVVIGGPEDRALTARVCAAMDHKAIDAAGRLTLRQSAELIRRCRVLVSNDSAPLHLGVAMGTHVVAIFGPTVREFGFAPLAGGHVVVERALPCRPCGIHGGRSCPIGTHECMTGISATLVFRAVQKLWTTAISGDRSPERVNFLGGSDAESEARP
ncbi:MAG: glycosyltransferase family 9 protein [Candidatus Oleimicrobiaceae bacterium]